MKLGSLIGAKFILVFLLLLGWHNIVQARAIFHMKTGEVAPDIYNSDRFNYKDALWCAHNMQTGLPLKGQLTQKKRELILLCMHTFAPGKPMMITVGIDSHNPANCIVHYVTVEIEGHKRVVKRNPISECVSSRYQDDPKGYIFEGEGLTQGEELDRINNGDFGYLKPGFLQFREVIWIDGEVVQQGLHGIPRSWLYDGGGSSGGCIRLPPESMQAIIDKIDELTWKWSLIPGWEHNMLILFYDRDLE